MKLQSIHDIFKGAVSPQYSGTSYDSYPNQEDNSPDDLLDISMLLDSDDDDEEKLFDEQAQDPGFQDNLAEDMDDTYLNTLSSKLLDEIEKDELDRAPYMDMVRRISSQIGVVNESNYEEIFPGCSTVVFPLITKAQIQFQARALPEIFPNDPVKSLILGDSTPELERQADRVAATMNYQVQYQDKGNKPDFENMLWWLPLAGSTFRYVFHDPLTNINKIRFVTVGNLIVPYDTASLADAYRIAHRFSDTKNDILKLQQVGFYRDIAIYDAEDDNEEDNAVTELRNNADGVDPHYDNINTNRQICYNIYTYCDLMGYEDLDDDGNETGIELPYVFTIHKSTKKILAIRRNWSEDDPYKIQRVYFSHYKYQQGPGFYGWGLPHIMGSLQESSTGALRAFCDSMGFSLLQGGFKLKSATITGDQVMKPGEYLDIDAEIEDINKAIKPLDYPAPSPQVLQLIALLKSEAEELVSTTDIMTGNQSPQNSPVGSTLAMIEQANKVITAQHKSLYASLSDELQILADLNYDFLPEEDQFVIPGKAGTMMREDFDGSIAVLPTADPSVSSFQQRQAIDQATMQLLSTPDFKPFVREAGYPLMMRIMKNLGIPDPEAIVLNEQEALQMQQQQQQNPPPNPDLIKAQVMQQDSQVKAQDSQVKAQVAQTNAQIAQTNTQLQAQEMQFKQQIEQANNQIEMLKLQLADKKINMDYATNDKMIDARFVGTVAPALQSSSDALAMQNIDHQQQQVVQQQTQQHEQQLQQQQQQHQQMMQQMQAQQGDDSGATPPTTQLQSTPDQGDAIQQNVATPPPMQQAPNKRNILMSLMNKIRGK